MPDSAQRLSDDAQMALPLGLVMRYDVRASTPSVRNGKG
jgi:hypothetical protein